MNAESAYGRSRRLMPGGRSAPKRTPRTTRSPALVWRCDECGQPVRDGDGFLGISWAELNANRRASQAWACEHRVDELNVFTVGQLAALPNPVRWRAFHLACDPDLEADGYWIAVARIRTPAALIHWSAHLGEKRWLSETNWTALLHHHADRLGWAA